MLLAGTVQLTSSDASKPFLAYWSTDQGSWPFEWDENMVIIDLPAGVTTFNKFLDVEGFGDSGAHVTVWDTDLMASGEYFITRSQHHLYSSDFFETIRLSVGAGKTYLGIELD